MLNGLITEQVGECDAPVIVLDHKGEYVPITELAHLSGLIAGSEQAKKHAEKRDVPFFELTTKNADAFVKKVITEHLQAIVVLPSYESSWLARASIVCAVGQALMRYSEAQRENEEPILPCLVLVDEAQLYFPQHVELLPSVAKRNPDILDNLFNAYLALVSNGRSNGYTMCFATQSLTYIAKWTIKSCQIKVLMRHVEHNDLEAIEKSIKGTVTREEMITMPAGVGVVSGFTPKPMIVQFDTRQSRDESETPGIGRLRAHANREAEQEAVQEQGSPDARRIVDGLLALYQEGKLTAEQCQTLLEAVMDQNAPSGTHEGEDLDDDPGEQPGEENDQDQESVAYVPPPRLLRPTYKYEEYYPVTEEAYRLGYTGKRKLADFIGAYGKSFKVDPIGSDKALQIIREMQEREMLEGDEEVKNAE
jgi:hypothetical protein